MKKLIKSFITNHPMVEDARPFEFKRKWLQKTQILWIGLLSLAFVVIGSLTLAIPLSFPLNFLMNLELVQNFLDGSPEVWTDFSIFFINLPLFFGGIYVVMALYARFIEKRSLKALGFVTKNKGKKLIQGFLFGLISMAIVALLIVGFTESTFSTEHLSLSGWNALPMVLLLLIPWGIQASAEELVFQGWLTPHLGKKYGLLMAVSVSSFLFMFVHLLNPGINLMGILNLVLYGIFAAFYMLHEKSILGIAGYHIAWNWAQGNVFGSLVSGGGTVPASIFGLHMDGNALLTGGDFGTEGSLVVSIVLLISLSVIFYLQHRKMRQEN